MFHFVRAAHGLLSGADWKFIGGRMPSFSQVFETKSFDHIKEIVGDLDLDCFNGIICAGMGSVCAVTLELWFPRNKPPTCETDCEYRRRRTRQPGD